MNATSDVREIAALVPMPRLLATLGFTVNERTRRCACILHGGSNPTAFSWHERGHWRCFSCGAGGDRIALARAVRRCSFREAVRFLAVLAGIEYKPGFLSRETIECQKKLREREAAEADSLLAEEFAAWRTAQDVVFQLEAICRNASGRLDALHRAEPERWTGEAEWAWEALAEVYRQMPRAAAAYYVISFPPAKDRFAFAMGAEAREKLTDEALDRGWVADAKGYRFEVEL
jgi:CHC2-type zinc finger protein